MAVLNSTPFWLVVVYFPIRIPTIESLHCFSTIDYLLFMDVIISRSLLIDCCIFAIHRELPAVVAVVAAAAVAAVKTVATVLVSV